LQRPEIRDNYHLGNIFFKRDPHNAVLESLDNPVLCGFSCYQWNRTYSIALAKKIKDKWPNCTIVFGGPEVTLEFQNYSIDSLIFGEGEVSFVQVLLDLLENKTPEKVYHQHRLDDLEIPSPYQLGLFDQLIKEYPGTRWATTLETNRGCPFACTFCSVTYSKVKKFSLERVEDDIKWIANNPVAYIFCADANFGIFKQRDVDIAKMIAKHGSKSDTLDFFNATFNKNNNHWSFKILHELGDLNRGFTVSMQSLNPDTLKEVKRSNLGINNLEDIFKQCREENIPSYSELILGLPYETKESFISGLCELLRLGQHTQIEIWFTY
jgi:radical SAM superfamily enzyme YgiQ (UPF0313 family)